jgi:toxin ParE1/3/4
MTTFRLELTSSAERDLNGLYDYIARAASRPVALGYLKRIQQAIEGLRTFPERGTARDDLRPGYRIVGFERRVAILFAIDGDVVRIHGVLYGGRAIPSRFANDNP